jgi:hypothetical protein
VRLIADAKDTGPEWRVYELGTFKPEKGDRFYFAVTPKTCPEMMIDCLWLEEVAEE